MVNLFGLVVKTASLRPLPTSLDVDAGQLLFSVETKGRGAGKWTLRPRPDHWRELHKYHFCGHKSHIIVVSLLTAHRISFVRSSNAWPWLAHRFALSLSLSLSLSLWRGGGRYISVRDGKILLLFFSLLFLFLLFLFLFVVVVCVLFYVLVFVLYFYCKK